MTSLTSHDAKRPLSRRFSVPAALLTIGQLGCAHSFFGNLYEAIVRVPHRISAEYATLDGDQRLHSLFGPTSPVRYYLPGIPLSVGATTAALLTRRHDPHDRRWLSAGTTALVASTALTGYLIRNVNIRLFVEGQPLTPIERNRLLRTWYRLNTIRIVSVGSAWVAIEKVRLASSTTTNRKRSVS